jgi:integral membrane protein
MFILLKWSAALEGISVLLLYFVAMPLKYFMNLPALVRPVGLMHGILFMLYVVFVLIVGLQRKWTFGIILISWILSLLPFGTFYAEKKYFK